MELGELGKMRAFANIRGNNSRDVPVPGEMALLPIVEDENGRRWIVINVNGVSFGLMLGDVMPTDAMEQVLHPHPRYPGYQGASRENAALPLTQEDMFHYGIMAEGSHSTEECGICMVNLTNNVMKTPCKHVYHSTCLGAWLGSNTDNPTCPGCRFIFAKMHPPKA